jgi:hypothetical protein
LDETEKTFTGDASSLPPATLVKKLGDAKLLVGQLVADFAPAAQNRLKTLETKRDLFLATVLKKTTEETGRSLTALETLSTEQLTHEKQVAQVAAGCKQVEEKLRPLEQLLKPEAEALKLPADLEARIAVQRKRLNSFQADVDSFAKLREETAKAASLADYKAVLQKWQEVKFVEAAPAIRMLDSLPTEKGFEAALLTGGDESVLQAIVEDKSTRHMAPDLALEADQKTLLSLMHDENLNDIFESTAVNYTKKKATSVLYSRGKVTETVVGTLLKWTARFYDPAVNEPSVLFFERSFTRVGDAGGYQGEAVTSTHLSKTSQFLNNLGINRLLDEKGERVLHPLLEVLDKLVRDEEGSPIARAYVMLKLEGMMNLRPFAWGLHLCPSLAQELHSLHQVLGSESLRSEDWMIKAMRDKWEKPLSHFFVGCHARQYMKEASARREYLRAVAAAGLRFVGYVEVDGSLKLNQAGLNASEWWVLDAKSKKPLLVSKKDSAASAPLPVQRTADDSLQPLSPVFEVAIDRKQLAQKYQSSLTATGTEYKPLPGESVYLTAP